MTKLVGFLDSTTGGSPHAGVIMDAAGNLFGTTSSGGANGYGTIFRISRAGAFSTLYSFQFATGGSPEAGLVADANGNLYGTTIFGPTGTTGVVYKLSDSGYVVPEPSVVGILLACTPRRRRLRNT
jgi:uncharacterized repeat protein (TIGR03803 family)